MTFWFTEASAPVPVADAAAPAAAAAAPLSLTQRALANAPEWPAFLGTLGEWQYRCCGGAGKQCQRGVRAGREGGGGAEGTASPNEKQPEVCVFGSCPVAVPDTALGNTP